MSPPVSSRQRSEALERQRAEERRQREAAEAAARKRKAEAARKKAAAARNARVQSARSRPSSRFVEDKGAPGTVKPSESSSGASKAKELVDLARKQLGYKEGANNQNKFSPLNGIQNAPWCASFVSAMIKEAGIKGAMDGNGSAAVAGLTEQYRKNGRYRDGDYKPQPGDLVFFGTKHVEMVEAVKPNEQGVMTVYTIGGNTSDMVAARNYPLGAGSITGYGQTIGEKIPGDAAGEPSKGSTKGSGAGDGGNYGSGPAGGGSSASSSGGGGGGSGGASASSGGSSSGGASGTSGPAAASGGDKGSGRDAWPPSWWTSPQPFVSWGTMNASVPKSTSLGDVLKRLDKMGVSEKEFFAKNPHLKGKGEDAVLKAGSAATLPKGFFDRFPNVGIKEGKPTSGNRAESAAAAPAARAVEVPATPEVEAPVEAVPDSNA